MKAPRGSESDRERSVEPESSHSAIKPNGVHVSEELLRARAAEEADVRASLGAALVERERQLEGVWAQLRAAREELERARAEIERARGELVARDERQRILEGRQAYRFTQALIEAKRNPQTLWRLPIAFAKLVTPRPVRDVIRISLNNARQQLDASLDTARRQLDSARQQMDASVTGVRQQLQDSLVKAKRQVDAGVTTATRAMVRQLEVIRAERWPASEPLVTVVVICFNYGRFIDEAIESLLRQTLTDVEILIVEGGSTDGTTPDRVALIEHPRVRKIFQPRPTKVAQNRLDGLLAARGKYIVFLDADDLLAPTYLEKALVALEMTGADIAYSSVQEFGLTKNVWEPADEFTLENLAKVNTIPTVAMFRRDTWERLRIGYPMDVVPGLEDFDFWLRFAERGARGYKIREPLMLYRVHGNSLTDTVKAQYPQHLKGILEEHRRALTPRRQAVVTQLQRGLPRVEAPLLNLERLEAPGQRRMSIALALPWMVTGGSDALLLQIFGDLRQRNASLAVYATLGAPPSMGASWRTEYEKVTPDVFELTEELPPSAHADAVMHILRSRGSRILMIVGSALTYDLLPRIRRELPHIKVVDHLYNLFGHLANNRRNAALIDFHIVANEDIRSGLIAQGEDPAKICVLHHGIDMGRYSPAQVSWKQELERLTVKRDHKLVLYAGRFSEEKGVLRFVDLAHRMRERQGITFAMIGDGPQRPAVEARIREHGLEGAVQLLGFVDDSRPYLRRADAVIIPSDVEGLPLVSLEALGLGTPVVASRIGALPSVVQVGINGHLAEPAELESFVRAIDQTLELDPDRERLAQTCRSSVVERFGIEGVRAGYFAVFEKLLGETNGAEINGAAINGAALNIEELQ